VSPPKGFIGGPVINRVRGLVFVFVPAPLLTTTSNEHEHGCSSELGWIPAKSMRE